MAKFTDNFTFGLVMQNKDICRKFIEMILPGEDFGEVILRPSTNPFYDEETDDLKADISEVTREKFLKYGEDSKGVRFDILAKGRNAWFTIEMQMYDEEELGKRCRYYQSNMDLEMLESGAKYKELKTTFIIFICTYDPFDSDKPIYYFEKYDRKNELQLNDFAYTIILNTSCSKEKVPEHLKGFYEYINNPENAEKNGFVKELDRRVSKFTTTEWRVREVTFGQIVEDREEAAYKKGHSAGKEQGIKQGLEQGHLEAKTEDALAMKKRGIGFKIISEITGLSIEEIEKLN